MNKRQQKLQENIINVTAQIVHDKHFFHIGLRKGKPSYNKLYKLCAEYIDLGLQSIKSKHNIEILPIKGKDAVVIDERIPNLLKSSIVEYGVHEYSFYVVQDAKRKFTVTASGRVKEGTEAKLTSVSYEYYIALLGVVNELLEYGTMMAMNQLHELGVLYADAELLELMDALVVEETNNNENDTNNHEAFEKFTEKIDQIVFAFIDEDIDLAYSMDTESTERPLFGIELVSSKDDTSVVEVCFIEGKYDTSRTTGESVSPEIVETCCKFISALDLIFIDRLQNYQEEQNV